MCIACIALCEIRKLIADAGSLQFVSIVCDSHLFVRFLSALTENHVFCCTKSTQTMCVANRNKCQAMSAINLHLFCFHYFARHSANWVSKSYFENWSHLYAVQHASQGYSEHHIVIYLCLPFVRYKTTHRMSDEETMSSAVCTQPETIEITSFGRWLLPRSFWVYLSVYAKYTYVQQVNSYLCHLHRPFRTHREITSFSSTSSSSGSSSKRR